MISGVGINSNTTLTTITMRSVKVGLFEFYDFECLFIVQTVLITKAG